MPSSPVRLSSSVGATFGSDDDTGCHLSRACTEGEFDELGLIASYFEGVDVSIFRMERESDSELTLREGGFARMLPRFLTKRRGYEIERANFQG